MLGMKQGSQIISLDIGGSSIKAVQVGWRAGRAVLEGGVVLRRQEGSLSLEADEVQRLLRALRRGGLTASRVVLVAPSDALVGGSMEMPPAESDVAREKIIRMELSRAQKLSPGSFELVWWDLPMSAEGSRPGQVHTLALPHQAVQQTLEGLARGGLQVVRTVPSSFALLSAAQRYPIDPRRISAVVDLGAVHSHLSLMVAGRVVHERRLPDFNLRQLCSSTSMSLGIDVQAATYALGRFGINRWADGAVECEITSLIDEACQPLAEEIGMSFTYVSHLYPDAELGPLLLAGGGANLPGLSETLADMLELEVSVMSPGGLLVDECFNVMGQDPALSAAVGAAICERRRDEAA